MGASKLSKNFNFLCFNIPPTWTVCSTLTIGGKYSKNVISCHSNSCGLGFVSGNNDSGSLGASSRKELHNKITQDKMLCSCWVDIASSFNGMSTSSNQCMEARLSRESSSFNLAIVYRLVDT